MNAACSRTLAADQGARHIDYKGALAADRGGRRLGPRADGRHCSRARFVQRVIVPVLGVGALLAAIGLVDLELGRRAHQADRRGRAGGRPAGARLSLLFYVAGIAAIAALLRASWRCARPARASTLALLLGSIAGMVVLAGAENLITLFVGIELLSIPLYVLCASELRRRTSLEAGLKYLVIGSVGSATLLYGLALIYGATGSTDFAGDRERDRATRVKVTDPLLLTGVALAATGLAFKASVAPFHQWTPDVYEGAPTPITTFMAVATKAAAFAIFLRLFDEALGGVAGAVGPGAGRARGDHDHRRQRRARSARTRSSGCSPGRASRRPATSSPGVVVGTQLGLKATVFYLAGYLFMNVAAFAVVVARERVSEHGDDIRSLENLGAASPLLAVADDDGDALARRLPGHRGLHREVLFDRGHRGRQLRLARRDDRDRLDDLARLLPAGRSP